MRWVRAALAVLTLSIAAIAQASPVTYLLDHGSVSANVWLAGNVVAQGGGFLSAGFVEFDPATGQITDFSLDASSVTAFAPILPGDYDHLSLSISLNPAAGYSSMASGSNPWSVTLGPIAVAYSGFASDSTPPITVPPAPVSGVIPISSFGVTAYLTQGEMRLGLIGVKVGEVSIGGQIFDVRADIEFVGFAAPEPAVASLVTAALAGLAIARGVRRR
jgi:hypothetical protein